MPGIKIRNAALAAAAQQHVELMKEKYAEKMKRSAESSVIYGGPDRTPVRRSGKKCKQVFRSLDSLSAAILYEGKGKVKGCGAQFCGLCEAGRALSERRKCSGGKLVHGIGPFRNSSVYLEPYLRRKNCRAKSGRTIDSLSVNPYHQTPTGNNLDIDM